MKIKTAIDPPVDELEQTPLGKISSARPQHNNTKYTGALKVAKLAF